MATIPELEANLLKMQQLVKAAQNEVQQKTFQDIVTNLTQQLEIEKSKLNSSEGESLKVDESPPPEENKQLILDLQPKPEYKIEAESENNENESLSPKQDYAFQGLGVLYGKIVKRYEDNDGYYN